MSEVNFPFGDADVQSLAAAATQTLTITNSFTIVDNATPIAAAITDLSLSASDDLPVGAKIMLDIQQGGTGYNIAFGSSGDTIVAPDLTGVANDRDVLLLVWNGTDWAAETAAWNKIVDAV